MRPCRVSSHCSWRCARRGSPASRAPRSPPGWTKTIAAKTLSGFADAGLAKLREGRATGFMLLPAGTGRLDELLAEEGLRTSEDLCDCYDRFMQLNPRVLKVCSDWQLQS